jgi:nitrite reductase/ring-hydroxylating ferredoxin subunit
MVAGRLDEVRPGTTKRVVTGGNPVLPANDEATVNAIGHMCTHADSSLSTDFLRDSMLHGSRFSAMTGDPVEPAAGALRTRAVYVEDGGILAEADA